MKKLLVASAGESCEVPFADMFDSVEFCSKFDDTDKIKIDKDTVLLLEGGRDVDPFLYHQTRGFSTQTPDIIRDTFEIKLINSSLKKGGKILGICRGSQLITVALGGLLIQHVTGHRTDHMIETSEGNQIVASSEHHQMMLPYPISRKSWELLAWSLKNISTVYKDGTDQEIPLPHAFREPEIVWYKNSKALAIQGHPEWFAFNSLYVNYCRKLVKELLL